MSTDKENQRANPNREVISEQPVSGRTGSGHDNELDSDGTESGSTTSSDSGENFEANPEAAAGSTSRQGSRVRNLIRSRCPSDAK